MAERDTNGRFKDGNKASPGRSTRSTEEKYLKKLNTSTTLKDWRAITIKAIDDAKRGDSKARQWLSDYLIGKPKQGVEIESIGEILFRVMREDKDL